ncbi:MAG: polysulfide reductase NrfD [candidate division Zixibacteria bacterium]|nr:polysulfide reductase NrfD [candidate division Zixibacteria bacterium]
MLEKALSGDKRYWTWIAFLLLVIGVGTLAYLKQYNEGLGITGLSRDVTWGFYIAQLTFLVGVAASAVMVVLPYYLHNFKAFGKITILGEFLAIASVIMCMTFVFVDLGQPTRMVNMFLYPSLNSVLFWDSVVLSVYLLLNLLISWVMLGAEKKDIAPPKWIKPLIYLSIPWAVSIHTVTAFLYSGLAARPFWLSAVIAPRFLASAFAAGPALLIIICMLLRKLTKFDAGDKAIDKLAVIMTYAMSINIFLILMELFTALYSGIPEHISHFEYLFLGIGDKTALVPWMWFSIFLAIVSLIILHFPKLRANYNLLALGSVAVFFSIWIDKGMGMVVTGFVPNPLGIVTEYLPTLPEVLITIGIYALGALIVTGLYKIALAVKEKAA